MSVISQALTTARPSCSPALPIRTTLYDLIAAINEVIGPDEEDLVPAVVAHLLRTYRVTGLGDLAGVRMVCDTAPSYSRIPEESLSF
jgi:hypothetical protein